MIAISAHFDGKVIVPDEPVQLPVDRALIVTVEAAPEKASREGPSALAWFAENAVDRADLPDDLSYQHDHYLYGTH